MQYDSRAFGKNARCCFNSTYSLTSRNREQNQHSNMMYIRVVVVVMMLAHSASSVFADCDCSVSGHKEIAELAVDGRVDMRACGNKDVDCDAQNLCYSGILVTRCETNDTLLNYTLDETILFEVEKLDSHRVVCTEMAYVLLGENWTPSITPKTEYVFRVNENKSLEVSVKNVFHTPPLSASQRNAIDSLCLRITEEIGGRSNNELEINERTIYMLYMGHLDGIECATKTLARLSSDGILDGANAETLSECGF